MHDMVLETDAGEFVEVGIRSGGIALTVRNENGRRVNLLTPLDAANLIRILALAASLETEANA
jgi:hypothetical protein